MSSQHQGDGERAVFIDPYLRAERRRNLIVAALCLVGAGSFVALYFGDASSPWSYFFIGGMLAGIVATLWSAHAALSGQGADEFPHIVVDNDGVHFKRLRDKHGDTIIWSRVKSVDRDESALILSIQPEDLASDDPGKRISIIRIAVDEQRRAGLPAAIDRFRMRSA